MLRLAAYFSYYETPPVIAAIQALGHDYNDAPQPLGYDDCRRSTRRADLPATPRGSYKCDRRRSPGSTSPALADLDLPVAQAESADAALNARRHDPVDVLVIGSGMGGAVASRVLAEAGLKVVCLEQGGWTRPEDHPHYSPDWEWQRLTGLEHRAERARAAPRTTRSTRSTKRR